MIYYAIGEPSHAQNPQAIFKGWVTFLVYHRNKKAKGVIGDSVITDGDAVLVAEQLQDIWTSRLNTIMPLFTYEMVLGICPICTFWWYSFITIAIPLFIIGTPFWIVFFLYTFSQILNKILIKWI